MLPICAHAHTHARMHTHTHTQAFIEILQFWESPITWAFPLRDVESPCANADMQPRAVWIW